eukprot:779327-Amphidinium_carterae.4
MGRLIEVLILLREANWWRYRSRTLASCKALASACCSASGPFEAVDGEVLDPMRRRFVGDG